jgi:hypothetical protein
MWPLNDLVHWLLNGPVRLPSGPWLSWISEDHSGYPYAEASAIALRAANWWHTVTGQELLGAHRIPAVQFLEQSVGSDGLVHRDGIGFLFDSLLVLTALDGTCSGGQRNSVVADQMESAISRNLESRSAVTGAPCNRWSHRFGPHLLKALGMSAHTPRWKNIIQASIGPIIAELTAIQGPEGQLVHPDDDGVYLHAHCYALEGLAIFDRMGIPDCRKPFLAGLSYLRRQQRPDGGFPQWTHNVEGPYATDITAQAGRLMLVPEAATDEQALTHIDKALGKCLGNGGIRYLSNSLHENTWCTAFVLQYAYGRQFGLEPDQWV